MNINPVIKQTLGLYNVNEAEGILCLLSLYHNLNEHIVPEMIHKQINLTKIVERDYNKPGSIIWNIPLYENEVVITEWDWIEAWRLLFGKLRNDAIGNKKSCDMKMRKYFAEHPSVRMQDVIKATMLYLTPYYNKKKDVAYLQRADYFISKIIKAEGGTEYNSRLDMYLEILKQQEGTPVEQSKQLNQVVK